jgi:hypothetical protein
LSSCSTFWRTPAVENTVSDGAQAQGNRENADIPTVILDILLTVFQKNLFQSFLVWLCAECCRRKEFEDGGFDGGYENPVSACGCKNTLAALGIVLP